MNKRTKWGGYYVKDVVRNCWNILWRMVVIRSTWPGQWSASSVRLPRMLEIRTRDHETQCVWSSGGEYQVQSRHLTSSDLCCPVPRDEHWCWRSQITHLRSQEHQWWHFDQYYFILSIMLQHCILTGSWTLLLFMMSLLIWMWLVTIFPEEILWC